MPFSHDDISINTIIGAGSAVSGDIRVGGFVRVDGDIDGNIETVGRIIIGEKARIRGNVTASSVIVGGVIEGDIIAPESVQLFSTAAVVGDIITRRLQVADQVVLHGYCISLENEADFEKAKEKWLDVKTLRRNSLGTAL